ncbi:MAG: L-threonylcarbamoyladenylate synthase [Syntrophomonas sp.]
MQTQYLKVDPEQPETEIIARAAELIGSRELVAFPTETVYGLGAGAYYPEAVNKIFIAKQRPAANPLLVHVSNQAQVKELVLEVPPAARLLMNKFWPGPLSLVLPARASVPSVVTGGKSSVGLRMPDHPVALALIEAAGPIAAPSANLSGRPSPLTAGHVRDDLDGRIAAVLDAGSTGLGLESTIIDFSQGRIQLIRRGAIALETLEEISGERIALPDREENEFAHHQIKAEIVISENEESFWKKLYEISQTDRRLGVVLSIGRNCGAVSTHRCNEAEDYNPSPVWLKGTRPIKEAGDIFLPRYNNAGASTAGPNIISTNYKVQASYKLDLNSGSSNLYGILRDAEQQQLDILLFAPLALDGSGIAASLWDRIKQAAKK